MLFWTHLALSYLAARVGTGLAGTDRPGDLLTVGVIATAAVPDLVDKPLAWSLGLPTRNVLHTVLVGGPLLLVVGLAAWRLSRPRLGLGVAGSYLIHLLADAADVLFLPGETLGFLLWPLLSYHHHAASALTYYVSPYSAVQTVVTLFVVGLWIRDGHPGTNLPLRRQ